MDTAKDTEYVIAHVLNLDGSVEKKRLQKSALNFDVTKYQDANNEIYIFKDVDNKNRVCTIDTFYDLETLRYLAADDTCNHVSSDAFNNKRLGFMHSFFTYIVIPFLILFFFVASIGTAYYLVIGCFEYGVEALWTQFTPFGLRLCMLFTTINLMNCFIKKSISSTLAYRTFLHRFFTFAILTILENILFSFNKSGLFGILGTSVIVLPIPLFVWLYYKDRLDLLSTNNQESTMQYGTYFLLRLLAVISFLFFVFATLHIAGPQSLSFYIFITVTFPITIIKNFMEFGFSTYYSSVTISAIACCILFYFEYNTFEEEWRYRF